MRSPLFTAANYLRHQWSAIGAHGIHSPFVFQLYREVIRKRHLNVDASIEKIRKELTGRAEHIDYKDFKTGQIKPADLSQIAKTSPSPRTFSAFLQRLCDFMSVQRVVEAGTSLGLNALYLAKAATVQQLVTLEGNASVGHIAQQMLQQHASNTQVVMGDIYKTFPETIEKTRPQLVFLDADHRNTAIDFYLEHLYPFLDDIQCIVLHDIYWSPDMAAKWEQVQHDPRFPLTIDIFQAGLIFPQQDMEKQHFRLRF